MPTKHIGSRFQVWWAVVSVLKNHPELGPAPEMDDTPANQQYLYLNTVFRWDLANMAFKSDWQHIKVVSRSEIISDGQAGLILEEICTASGLLPFRDGDPLPAAWVGKSAPLFFGEPVVVIDWGEGLKEFYKTTGKIVAMLRNLLDPLQDDSLDKGRFWLESALSVVETAVKTVYEFTLAVDEPKAKDLFASYRATRGRNPKGDITAAHLNGLCHDAASRLMFIVDKFPLPAGWAYEQLRTLREHLQHAIRGAGRLILLGDGLKNSSPIQPPAHELSGPKTIEEE